MKIYMVKRYNFGQDFLVQLEAVNFFTFSSEFVSQGQSDFSDVELVFFFFDVFGSSFVVVLDTVLVNFGILIIDVVSVSLILVGNFFVVNNSFLGQVLDFRGLMVIGDFF